MKLATVLSLLLAVGGTDGVVVDYYFGSLWPGCKQFGGGDYVKLFNDFGASAGTNTTFNVPCPAVNDPAGHCIHEPNCAWETLTLCAFNQTDLKGSINFLACMDGIAEIGGNATAAGTTCAAKSSPALDFSKMSACAGGSQGKALLTAASAKYTKAIASEKPAMVPDVQLDGKHIIPAYTYARVKSDLCAAGSTAKACSSPAPDAEQEQN